MQIRAIEAGQDALLDRQASCTKKNLLFEFASGRVCHSLFRHGKSPPGSLSCRVPSSLAASMAAVSSSASDARAVA